MTEGGAVGGGSVLVGIGVSVGVDVGVSVGVYVAVGVGVFVGVGLGVKVGVGVWVAVAVRVRVALDTLTCAISIGTSVDNKSFIGNLPNPTKRPPRMRMAKSNQGIIAGLDRVNAC